MENKKTTELLDLLQKLEDKDYQSDGKYQKIIAELKRREPFYSLMSEEDNESLPALLEKIGNLELEIKKLKRHRHDEKTNDVLIRI